MASSTSHAGSRVGGENPCLNWVALPGPAARPARGLGGLYACPPASIGSSKNGWPSRASRKGAQNRPLWTAGVNLQGKYWIRGPSHPPDPLRRRVPRTKLGPSANRCSVGLVSYLVEVLRIRWLRARPIGAPDTPPRVSATLRCDGGRPPPAKETSSTAVAGVVGRQLPGFHSRWDGADLALGVQLVMVELS